jgi:hypothetical protein
MKPIVSIELDEYNRLKDIEYQMKFLIDNVELHKEELHGFTTKKYGVINSEKLDFFYKNLLDIDELIIEHD